MLPRAATEESMTPNRDIFSLVCKCCWEERKSNNSLCSQGGNIPSGCLNVAGVFPSLLLLIHHSPSHPLLSILHSFPSKVTSPLERSNALGKVMKLNVEAPNG